MDQNKNWDKAKHSCEATRLYNVNKSDSSVSCNVVFGVCMCVSDRFMTSSHIFTLLQQFYFTWMSDRKIITTLCSIFINGA